MLMINMLASIFPGNFFDIFFMRFGLGGVVAHPDVTINGKRFYKSGGGLIPTVWMDGYQFSGLCAQFGFNIYKKIKNKFLFNAETKISYARAEIHLEDEYVVNIPNFSIHFLMGISFRK